MAFFEIIVNIWRRRHKKEMKGAICFALLKVPILLWLEHNKINLDLSGNDWSRQSLEYVQMWI